MTRDIFDATVSGNSAPRLTAFLSNSTASPEAYTRTTVHNRPDSAPGKNTHLSESEQAHYLAVEKLRQESGLSDLLYCTNLKTETSRQTNEEVVTNTYFNTKCDAIAYPEPFVERLEIRPVYPDISEVKDSSSATSPCDEDALPPSEESIIHGDNVFYKNLAGREINRKVLKISGQNLRPEIVPTIQQSSSVQGPAILTDSFNEQVRSANNVLSIAPLPLTTDKVINPSDSRNSIYSDNGDNIFSSLASQISNALYETGRLIIPQHDPLRFPGADAKALPVSQPSHSSNIPEGLGLKYKSTDGKNIISLDGYNYHINWNVDKHKPEIAMRKYNGEIDYVPVYMEQLSNTWHLSTRNQQPVFSRKQEEVINELKQVKDAGSRYISMGNKNKRYYGNGEIYINQKADGKGRYPDDMCIEMNGEIVPVREVITAAHGIHYEVFDPKKPDKRGYPAEWDGKRWIF